MTFKSTDAAFEYAQEFFEKTKLSLDSSYIGIVKLIDKDKNPAIYMLEIVCETGNFLKRKSTKIVAAVKHSDLKSVINVNDLVVFGPDNIGLKIPTGYLLYKLEPEIDAKTNRLKVCNYKGKFKVFVDDHFHYQNIDERYLQGEYENLEDAIAVCKKIVDQSLNSLLENCSLIDLKDRYYSFGNDPFIEGDDFSSSQYAEEKIQERISLISAAERGLEHWKHEIDYKYGLLLAESERLEGEGFIHFCQTNRNKLCASWDIKNKSWQVNVDRSLLEGLSFTTPNRFEKEVFGEKVNQQGYYLKQYLIEYLLLGLGVGEVKTLTKKVDNEAQVELSFEARTWNKMLIGNNLGVENAVCKYFEKTSSEERIITFGMICENWDINLELVFDEHENYEQHTFGIKDFGGYYT